MAKKKTRKKLSFSQKVMIVLSIFIVLSMVIGLFVASNPQALGG
jgi:hypothetical protein